MIFPQLKGQRVGYLNLDLWAQQFNSQRSKLKNSLRKSRFLDADFCAAAVDTYHTLMSLDWSYGDWMANRSFVWKGSYLEKEGTFTHLGVDFNVPAGTEVALDQDATVVRIDNDFPEEHGWGNRVIFKLKEEPIMLVYAHLSDAIKCNVGDHLEVGTIFAEVGTSEENGGWFPHLHVQAIRASHYEELLKNDLKELDGYGKATNVEHLARLFPDPMNYVRIW